MSRQAPRKLPPRSGIPAIIAAGWCLLLACSGGKTPESPETGLDFHPSSIPVGSSLVIRMAVHGVGLDTCQDASLTFSGTDLQPGMLEIVSAEEASFRLDAAGGAAPGTREASLICNGISTAKGQLLIEPSTPKASITLDPPSGLIGGRDLPVKVQGTNTRFSPGLTHFSFSSSDVPIDAVTILSTTEALLTVHINADTSPGKTDILAVTGVEVALGEWDLVASEPPCVHLLPNEVARGAKQAPLILTAEGMTFDEGTTTLTFPQNPGIQVDHWTLEEEKRIGLWVNVGQWASLGPTKMVVTCGDQTVETSLTILPASGEPSLRLVPERIDRQTRKPLIFLWGTNTHFDESAPTLAFTSAPTGKLVTGDVTVYTETSAALQLTVDPTIEPGWYDITVVTNLDSPEVVVASIEVIDSQKPALLNVTPDHVTQGARNLDLIVEGWNTAFSSGSPILGFLPTAGVAVKKVNVLDDTHLTVGVNVHPNAPVGTAHLSVESDAGKLEYPIEIDPVDGGPYMTFDPPILPVGQGVTGSRITISGASFADGGLVVFGDPTLSAGDLTKDSPEQSSLDVRVSPSAGSSPVAVEAETGTMRLASIVYVLATPRPRAWVQGSNALKRKGDPYNINLTIQGEGTGFDQSKTVASVSPASGLEVIQLSVVSETEAKVTLRVSPTGPEGLTGLLLRTSSEMVSAVVEVQGVLPFMDLILDPGTVKAGERGVVISVYSPLIPFVEGWTFAAFSEPGFYAGNVDWKSDTRLQVTVDVAATAAPEGSTVYLALISGQGVAVGELPVVPLERVDLPLGEPTPATLGQGETLLAFQPDQAGWYEADVRPDQDAGLDYSLFAPDGLSRLDDGGAPEPAVFPANAGSDHFLVLSGPPDAGIGFTAEVLPLATAATPEKEPNDSTPQSLGDLSTASILKSARIDAPDDVDAFRFTTDEPAAIEAVARFPMSAPWYGPAVDITLYDDHGGILDFSRGWPSAFEGDPILWVTPSSLTTYEIRIGTQIGGIGSYLINIRPVVVLWRVCGIGPSEGFLDLFGRPGLDLGDYRIEVVDPVLGEVKATVDLTGQVIGSQGRFRITSSDAVPEWDLVDPAASVFPTPFAVRIMKGTAVIDAVEAGGSGAWGEGETIDAVDAPCIERWRHLDGNNNRDDFVERWTGF